MIQVATTALPRAPRATRPRAPSITARTTPRGARTLVARVGRSSVDELTGEPRWVEVSDASAAIEDAREAYESGDYAAAVTTLEGALKLGGSGTKRDRAKPAELSMGELQAVWYNLTACWSTLGDVDKAIASLEKTLKAGLCSADLYGFNKANEDYNALMSDEGMKAAREDPRFKALVDRFNVQPTELQLQLDPSQSSIGRAIKMWGDKKK